MKRIARYGISTSRREIDDLVKAWIVISAAFAILYTRSIFSTQFLFSFMAAAITAGAGFLLHELAHKVVAERYGCVAEFRSNDQMLFLAIIGAFLGFLFAAPGAVVIQGYVNERANGKISVAGPVMNIVLAAIFYSMTFLSIPIVTRVAEFGVMINAWLAIFNMIPFWILDGKKVWVWSKPVWFSVVAIAGLFLLL